MRMRAFPTKARKLGSQFHHETHERPEVKKVRLPADRPSAAEPQPNRYWILQEAAEGTEKAFPWMARMNADNTIILGSVSATFSVIRGRF